MRKVVFIKGFTSTTAIIAFFLLFGTVGALETDLITIGQAIARTTIYLVYIVAMSVIYNLSRKKALRYGNTKRATYKNS